MQIGVGWEETGKRNKKVGVPPRRKGRKEGDLTLFTSQSSVYTGWKLFNKSNTVW